jgi:FkbM family methyltransferase
MDFLFALARRQKDVFFLEVGANDGVSEDMLHHFIKRYRWSGIALEPLPQVFATLQSTNRNSKNVIPLCAALADRDGMMTIWHVLPGTDVPAFCNMLGSFSREVVLSHRSAFPAIEQHVVEDKVQALCFETLVRRFNIERIDVILIDTEGYDFEVLKQIDFRRFLPSIVIYEHVHLTNKEKRESKALLEKFGYQLYNSCHTDYVAVRRRSAGGAHESFFATRFLARKPGHQIDER